MLLGKSFRHTVIASMSISVFSVVFGIVLSYYLDLAPSGTIVMISVAILVATLGAKYLGLVGKNTPIQKTI
jgi:zinc transport system permease protein